MNKLEHFDYLVLHMYITDNTLLSEDLKICHERLSVSENVLAVHDSPYQRLQRNQRKESPSLFA